jgi:class 3 adenylate cyclase
MMARYFDEMSTALKHHGRRVEKLIGNAVTAVFGAPTLHEDDALRAVRAGRLGEAGFRLTQNNA